MSWLYRIWQCTWGIVQTLLGVVLFFIHYRDPHFSFHGAIVTKWKGNSSLALGMFIFISEKPYFAERLKGQYTESELFDRLLVHEYGHTVQSMILGPLYLIIMGIPSTLWGFLPYYVRTRKTKHRSYFSFFTEKWANFLGEAVTKKTSMENLYID